MSITDKLFKAVLDGKAGRNVGIPTGLPIIDKYTYGVQRSYITTVFADSGAGKTTYTLFSYVYGPLKHALANNTDLSILFFSFEMSEIALMAKLMCLHIWDEYGEIISFKEILSLESAISDEKFAYIQDSKAWLESIEKYFIILDKTITPEQIGETLRRWNEKHGRFIELEDGQEEYIPHNKNMYKIAVLDHVSLIDKGKHTIKEAIDLSCKEFIYYRNKCDITGVFVQQANRGSKSMDRRNGGYHMLQTDDMQDSSGPAQASEIIIGIFFPYREKMNKIDGYDVKVMKDRIRTIQILKQRYGQADVNKCVNFFGVYRFFIIFV